MIIAEKRKVKNIGLKYMAWPSMCLL